MSEKADVFISKKENCMTNPRNSASSEPSSEPVESLPERVAGVPEQVNLDSESVAGEEDPGASLDLPVRSSGQPAIQPVPRPPGTINPGDEAPEGTPGTGETICRECGGSGKAANGPCPACGGSGKVTAGLGGA